MRKSLEKLNSVGRLGAYLLLLLTAASCFAGGAFNGGGGGESVRLDILSVRRYLIDNCEKWNSVALQSNNLSCGAIKAKIDEIGTSETRLRVADNVIRNGKEYDGWNRCASPEDSDITFSVSRWLQNRDVFSKIGFVMHEFLGCMGVEPTGDYHVTELLVMELRKKLGPDFKIHPDSVTFDLVRFKKDAKAKRETMIGLDSQGRVRVEYSFVRSWEIGLPEVCTRKDGSVSPDDTCNDRGTYTYISSRGIPLQRQLYPFNKIDGEWIELARATEKCPIRMTVSLLSGEILSKIPVCGSEE